MSSVPLNSFPYTSDWVEFWSQSLPSLGFLLHPGRSGRNQPPMEASPQAFWGISPTQSRVVFVQSLSHVRLFVPSWTAHQASLSSITSRILLKLMSIESVMPSSHLILCCPLLLLPPIPPSIRVLSNESTLHIRWPKYWSFSFSINPCNEYSGLISLRINWFEVQGTLKSLLQYHSSKASILQHSAFIMVQLSHPYMTTGKTIALTGWTFVRNVSAF